jgi:hypothetical protein
MTCCVAALCLWKLAKEDTEAAGALIDQLSTPAS